MADCQICGSPFGEPVYHSGARSSLTTMMRVYEQPTEVFFCGTCGHLQTTEVVDIQDYYAHQYEILAESPEEDQLYKIDGTRKIFQVEHRVATLLDKVDLPPHARVLDFGCAKGAVLKRLRRERPDIVPHCFEVTDRYIPFWRADLPDDQWGTQVPPPAWQASFDLVCSFYVLEHVSDPLAAVRQMSSLVRPGGVLYFLVPNALDNPADMVVADHLQHYSEPSLRELLDRASLEVIDIDSRAHDCAFVVVARRASPSGNPLADPSDIDAIGEKHAATARFWDTLGERVREFESARNGTPACIYGAGFYGNFLAACLNDTSTIHCFVDQNPYLQGKTVQGKPVMPPEQVNTGISAMYVGLNPAVARTVIAGIDCWRERAFETFFL